MANLGSITLNEIQIFEVDADPSIEGLVASTGSLAILTDGSKMFLKFAEGDLEWNILSPDSKYSYYTTSNVTTVNTTYFNVSDLITDSLPVGMYKFDFNGEFTSNSGVEDIKVKIASNGSTFSIIQGNGTIQIPDAPKFKLSMFGFLQITSAGSLVIQIKNANAGNALTLSEYALLTLEKI